MAAGLGFKTFVSGEVLTAADTNGYLMQGVMVFANASARSAAITAPTEGQYSYLKDTNSTEYYDGAAWVAGVEGDISGVTAGVGISGGGTSGTVTVTNSMATAIDAKGDLVAGTGADAFARLAVGTNGYGLVADSTAATGLAWKQEGLTLITSTAFSGATSVAVDNCFTSTYSNYVIEVVVTSGSGGAAQINMQLRAGGANNSTSNYNNAGSAFTYAGATDTTATASGTFWFAMRTNGSNWAGRLNLYNPQAAQNTWYLGQYADTSQTGYRGGYFNAATQFDGFTLVNSGATNIAGTIRVYGMAN
jgi:hypothetical protein